MQPVLLYICALIKQKNISEDKDTNMICTVLAGHGVKDTGICNVTKREII
jgi:hypothetical protein